MTSLILLIAILSGPRPFVPQDSTWMYQAYVHQRPYVFARAENYLRVDERALPGPCLWTYYEDGRLECHLTWDSDADSMLTITDFSYFGEEYQTRWLLPDLGLYGLYHNKSAIIILYPYVSGWDMIRALLGGE